VSADAALVTGLRTEVLAALSGRERTLQTQGRAMLGNGDEQALGRQLISEALERRARHALTDGTLVMSAEEEDEVARATFDALFRLNRLQRLLDDPDIENINANGCDVVWVRYADGRRERVGPIAESNEELIEMLRTAAARMGIGERRFDLGSPSLSLSMPDGSRLFALMALAAQPCVSIRRHRYLRVNLDDLVARGTLDVGLREFLGAVMRAKKSCIICGGIGAGKTTLLRAMAADIPPEERLITIEDSLELGLERFPELHPDVVALEAREPNLEGEGGVTVAELVRWALRMSPDRVIVGEARGEEVLALLNAMSQGTDGSMATLHASSSKGAFSKLATYAVQAPERLPLEATNLLVANAVHFVIHLAQDGERRFISSIREVVDADGPMVVSNEVFRPGPDGRAVPGAPLRAGTLDQLCAVGFDPGLLERPQGWWDRDWPSP
jgi:pilus assembly protein CpaF